MRKTIKKILANNYTYVFLGVIVFLYVTISLQVSRSSIYAASETSFEGVIEKKTMSENKITFELGGKEDLICNYYSEDDEEKNELWQKIQLGSLVSIEGKLKEPLANTIPNAFDYKKYLAHKNIFYVCTIEDVVVVQEPKRFLHKIKNFVINRIMTFEIRDYLYTMIIGDKSFLDEEVLNKYRENGVTHLFAISGMHIGLFALILSKVFKKCKVSNHVASVLTTIFIWFYAFLAGFGASVMRATLLFSLLTIDKMMDLKLDKLKILFLTGFILIMYRYNIVLDVGFIFSFVTTFGLIYASKILSKHKVLGTSLIAGAFSLPITINSFYKFNIASILFNLIFIPYVSTIVYPLCLLTFFIRWLEPLTILSIDLLELLNDLCAKVTFLQFVVPSLHPVIVVLYYIILLAFIRKRIYATCVILFMMILLCKIQPLLDGKVHVEFMDVGQGDSTVIRSAHNDEVILIDTGGKIDDKSSFYVSDGVITYLYSLGIDRIDYLILTHGDADHLGDFLNVAKKMKIGKVILNRGSVNEAEKRILESGVRVGFEYDGSLDLRFLNDKVWDDENANSIVAHLSVGEMSFLFMGDADKDVERYICKKYDLRASVVKLGHHGSKTSSDEDFLKGVGARIGIISSGRNNRYNHPSGETLKTLEKLKMKTYNTQIDGSILFEIGKKGVTISTIPP